METPNEALVTGVESQSGEKPQRPGEGLLVPRNWDGHSSGDVGPGELSIDLCWAPLTLGSSCLPASGSLG